LNQLSKILFFITLYFSLTSTLFAQVLVFEFELPGEEIPHVDLVTSVACADENLSCDIVYKDAFNIDVVKDFKKSLDESKATKVVNMSFAFEAPQISGSPSLMTGFNYDEQRKDFEELKNEMLSVIVETPDVLFSIAAGNGKGASGPITPGVPLGYSNQLYPAVYDASNKVVVAALETDKVQITKLDDYKIAEYSNYSLFKVDLVTHVQKWTDGKLLRGTSFSAPVVARLGASLSVIDQTLTALQIKEILMKSSYVQKIDQAIFWSKDWIKKGKESVLFNVHAHYSKQIREKLTQSLGGIMLVKSGGPLVEEVAYQCADNYKRAAGLLTITQACLQAHEDRLSASKKRQNKLKELWSLRGI